MVRDVRVEVATGIVVRGWRSSEDGLYLLALGQPEEVRLVCRCGRSHWIVREQFVSGKVSLMVTCHTCGTRGSFPMEGVTLAAP